MDNRSKKSRSRLMARVKSRGNFSTEQALVTLLKANLLHGWRRHYPTIGTPDFCWPKAKVALFVDGCFWHGCPRCHKLPKSNKKFWKEKVINNQIHDRRVNSRLRRDGWAVLRVWGCRVKEKRTILRIQKAVRAAHDSH